MLALLYDIHGNLPALDAVLADAREQGADRFLLGGDYALFGAWPSETVTRLRALEAGWIRGNGERWTAHPDEAPDDPVVQGAIAHCAGALGDAVVAELAALPEMLVHGEVRFCHGSPPSDVRSFMPEPEDDEAELLANVSEPRLVFGHTHLPFRRISPHGGVELLNPGSVGMPFDGDTQPAYAVIHDEGEIEHRRVDYDHEASASAVRALGGEWSETIAKRIEQARIDPA